MPAVMDEFEYLSKLGQGGFGVVMLARKRTGGKLCALKILKKSHMNGVGAAERAIAEAAVLQQMRHAFIAELYAAFQDDENVYFQMEYVGGGELYSHLSERRFSEDWTKFYAAELLCALDCVHQRGYMYRDLKAENVLVNADGHIKLIDFGTVKRVTGLEKAADRSQATPRNTVIGTDIYMAPEMHSGAYGLEVDFWALGVLIVEMLFGLGNDVYSGMSSNSWALRKGMVLRQMDYLDIDRLERELSQPCSDLILLLLRFDKARRIGCGQEGVTEIQRHRFFDGLDWQSLLRKELAAPLQPLAKERATRMTDSAYSVGSGTHSDAAEHLRHNFKEYQSPEEVARVRRGSLSLMDLTTMPAASQSSLLCEAASAGHLDELRKLVGLGVSVNLGDYDKRTAMHLAASEGQLDVVQCLVEELGAEDSPCDRWGGTPLDDALRQKHEAVASYLVMQGASTGIEANAHASSSALCDAAYNGHLARLRHLVLHQGLNANLGDYDRRTAIHLAASEGRTDTVRCLVEELSADHSPVDRWGGTPLTDCRREGHEATATYLVSIGAKDGRERWREDQLVIPESIGSAAEHGTSAELEPPEKRPNQSVSPGSKSAMVLSIATRPPTEARSSKPQPSDRSVKRGGATANSRRLTASKDRLTKSQPGTPRRKAAEGKALSASFTTGTATGPGAGTGPRGKDLW